MQQWSSKFHKHTQNALVHAVNELSNSLNFQSHMIDFVILIPALSPPLVSLFNSILI